MPPRGHQDRLGCRRSPHAGLQVGQHRARQHQGGDHGDLPLDLAEVEPFDAYLIRTAGIATVVIAVIGLVAAAVIPMAYCKYGCPTGFVLSFVRSHGPADRFSRRDLVAAMLLLLVVALSWQYETVQSWITR